MIAEIVAARRDNEDLLIICGLTQMFPLAERLRSQGENEMTIDVTQAD
jgi:hypothetical protein